MKIKPNQYYGYIDYEINVFYVVCIKPAGVHNPSEWIGQRNVKFVDMLCIDDCIISNLSMKIDWSKCNV